MTLTFDLMSFCLVMVDAFIASGLKSRFLKLLTENSYLQFMFYVPTFFNLLIAYSTKGGGGLAQSDGNMFVHQIFLRKEAPEYQKHTKIPP